MIKLACGGWIAFKGLQRPYTKRCSGREPGPRNPKHEESPREPRAHTQISELESLFAHPLRSVGRPMSRIRGAPSPLSAGMSSTPTVGRVARRARLSMLCQRCSFLVIGTTAIIHCKQIVTLQVSLRVAV